MDNAVYKLKILPVFEQDLNSIVDYISIVLQNPDAALRLIDSTEAAIHSRLRNPTAFEPFHSRYERLHPYYRIDVGNYYVFYVVIDDTVEVRRMLYSRQNWKQKL